ncbi:lactate racemase domain-containing protein [Rosistilla oblonga]|uniref:lactate racemase domain-containing protein n=1 Tax=Rosistilla oblonga TaxID=2527990 RepID=UPI003A9711AD
MTTYFARGSETAELSTADLREGLEKLFTDRGRPSKALAIPPDYSRLPSRAGEITCLCHELLGDAMVDVMPALGTHKPMSPEQLAHMFPSLPTDLIREHNWRNDVVTLGDVDADFVSQATEGIYSEPWPAQVNRLLLEGGHDMILSIGQVVPHEVIGMANYNKNIFVGTGGVKGINESHFLSAAYGMERTMGRADTPLRKILNRAQDLFCKEMPLVYILTVIGQQPDGSLVTRGLYIGDDHDTFFEAAELALKVNFTVLERAPKKMVCYLDPSEFHSTWIGNKSIYRTRLAIEDEGELIVLGPAVRMFGEDEAIDGLIRKYGYQPSARVMELVQQNEDLRNNLSAAAHLIHGSSENRFSVNYAPGELSQQEIESVGYNYGDVKSLMEKYPPEKLNDGWHTDSDGEEFYFIKNPALGLWASPGRV